MSVTPRKTTPVKKATPVEAASFRLIRVSKDTSNPKTIELSPGKKMTVGRGADVVLHSIRSPSDTSRVHATLQIRNVGILVENLSRNGVLVDGKPLPRFLALVVPVGHTVTFGADPSELHYRVDRVRAGVSTPPAGSLSPAAFVPPPPAVAKKSVPARHVSPVRKAPSAVATPRIPGSATPQAKSRASPVLASAETPDRKERTPTAMATQHVDPARPMLAPSRTCTVAREMLFIDGGRETTVFLDEWAGVSAMISQRNGGHAVVPMHAVRDALVTVRGRQQMQNDEALEAPIAAVARSTIHTLRSAWDPSSHRFSFTETIKAGLVDAICRLASEVALLQAPTCVPVPAPCFVFGDLHGSFVDLLFAFNAAVPLGHTDYSTAQVIFLGDFVDRGPHSVEVVAFLLAWQLLCPTTVHLLRGNHEDPSINGDVSTYGASSFLSQCLVFSPDGGSEIWERANSAFAALPLAAVLPHGIFACHGGIPDLRHYSCESSAAAAVVHDLEATLNELTRGLKFESLMPDASDDPARAAARSISRQLAWNDPGSSTVVRAFDSISDPLPTSTPPPPPPDLLFRHNEPRGDVDGAVLEFTPEATQEFFARFDLSLLLRAHQHKDQGLQLEFDRTVLTVFTSSNYCRENSAGACAVFPDGNVRLFSWLAAPASTHSLDASVNGFQQQQASVSAMRPGGFFGPDGDDASVDFQVGGSLPAVVRSTAAVHRPGLFSFTPVSLVGDDPSAAGGAAVPDSLDDSVVSCG